MIHKIPSGNWTTYLADAIEQSADGDVIEVHNGAMKELAENAKRRMCPGKSIKFSIKNQVRGYVVRNIIGSYFIGNDKPGEGGWSDQSQWAHIFELYEDAHKCLVRTGEEGFGTTEEVAADDTLTGCWA